MLCSPSYHCQNRKFFFIFFRFFHYFSFYSLNTIDQISPAYSSLILLIPAAMVPIWWRMHVTSGFVCRCARRQRCRRKLAEVVPCKDTIHILATALKSMASLTRNWRRCFTLRRKFIQFIWIIKNYAVKALDLINLTNLSVSITYFTISTILIIIIYRINLLFVLLRSEFWLGIPSSYYANF